MDNSNNQSSTKESINQFEDIQSDIKEQDFAEEGQISFNNKNKEIFQEYVIKSNRKSSTQIYQNQLAKLVEANRTSSNGVRILTSIDQISEEDKLFYIVDKDTGQILDSRNEEIVAQLIDQQNYSILEDTHIDQKEWKDFWKHVHSLNYQLLDAVTEGDIEYILKLFDKDQIYPIDINYKTLDDFTPIHFAILNNNFETLQILIKLGANIEAQSSFGRRPIHLAAIKGYAESLQILLLQTQIDINAQDKDFNTPLHLATERHFEHVIEILLKNNASLEKQNQKQQYPFDMTMDIKIRQLFIKYQNNNKQLYQQNDQQQQIANNQYNGMYISSNKEQLINKILLMTKQQSQNQQSKNFHEDQKENIQSTSKLIQKFQNQTISSKLQEPEQDIEQGKIQAKDFTYWSVLGKGGFGQVFLVERKQKFYAMKVLIKKQIKQHRLQKYIMAEQQILNSMNNPFITKLSYAFQNDQKLFLVMEYCSGGDLHNILNQQQNHSLDEDTARNYLAEIVLAIEALHKNCIIYRDLKPANVLVDEDGHLKLTDFGLSKQDMIQEKITHSILGTPAYYAPEMVNKTGHTRMVDWYTLGVFFYQITTGELPYFSKDRKELYEKIKKSTVKVPKNLSSEAKDLIKQLMNKNFQKRIGAQRDSEEIKEHPFFKNINWSDVYEKKLKMIKPQIKPLPAQPLKVHFRDEKLDNQDDYGEWYYNQSMVSFQQSD